MSKPKKTKQELEASEDQAHNAAAIRELLSDPDAKVRQYEAGRYHVILSIDSDEPEQFYSTRHIQHYNAKPKKINPPKGFGDVVETVTKATGIKKVVDIFTADGKDCGCADRKKKLNQIFPMGSANCMSKEQYNQWTQTRQRISRTDTVTPQDQAIIIDLIREVHNLGLKRGSCSSCSGAVWRKYIGMLDAVYETYQ